MSGPVDHQEWRADLAAYLLGSLDEDESAALEEHLESCESCREELRWLQPAVDLLPDSVERIDPPPRLRERLLAEVASDPDVAPQQANRGRRASDRKGFLRGFLLRPATGLAAIALVAAAVAGYALHDSGSSPATTTTRAQGPGQLRAALARSGNSGTLELTGLQQAPPSHVYQAWVQRSGGQVSLFDSSHDGTASVSLDDKLRAVKAVMVTMEPRGGSRHPTSPAVISVSTKR